MQFDNNLYETADTEYVEQYLPPKEYKLYAKRWLVLFAFCSFSFANSYGFVQNSPILKLTATYYNVDDGAIVWLSNMYYLTYFSFGLFSIKPLKMRLDISLIFASLLNSIGSWLKYYADDHYIYALAGYTLMGTSQIFILAAPVYISDRWFPANERALATSLGSFISQIAMNFTFMYVTIQFKNVGDEQDIILKQQHINFLSAILSSSAFIFCIAFVRNKPPTPPSQDSEVVKDSIVSSLGKIISKPKYFLNLIALSIFLGLSWTYTSVITIILFPYGFSQTEIGLIGLVFTLAGTIGGISASMIVDTQVGRGEVPKYDLFIKLFMTIGMLALIVQAFFIDQSGVIVTSITTAFIGIGLNSYYPIAVQSYIETLYPSFGLVLITALIIASNAFGFIGNYVLLLPIFNTNGLWVLVALALPFYIYIMLFYKTRVVRLQLLSSMNKSDC